LLAIAVVSLGYYGYVTAESYLYQAYETRELNTILASAPRSAVDGVTAAPRRRVEPAAGAAIGRIEIPRLGVSAIVRAGSDARTLRLAVGHIQGTAFPGERGNVVVAGHRYRVFWPLQRISVGDHLRLVTPHGTYDYFVDWTEVVDPDRIDLLGPTEEPALTLVTCYPFQMIGHAPERFVVRARLAQPAGT